jgi:hypothetical protein
MSTFRRRLSLPRTIVSLASAALLLLWGMPVYAVSIIAPKPNSQVKGTVRVSAAPEKGEEGFAYAILLVDNEQLSVTNVQPLRFEVDTTDFTNGAHLLQIQLSDLAGLMSKSKTVRIIIANPIPGAIVSTPKPAPVTSTVKPEVKSAPPKPVTLVVQAPPAPKPAPAPKPETAKPVPVSPKPVAPAPAPPKPAVATPKPAPQPPKTVVVPIETAPAVPAPTAAVPRPIRGAELTVVLDGKPLLLSVRPIIERGRAMVLLRPLVEAMGGQLGWNPVKKQAIATIDGHQYSFTIGESAVVADGASTLIDRSCYIVSGRTVVPITIWRDLFGGTIQFNGDYGCISLNSRPKQIMPGPAIAAR